MQIPSTLILLLALSAVSKVTAADQRFLAGAHAIDVTPTSLPVIVNGGFLAKSGEKTHGRLHMRCLVLDDGGTRIALGVLDSCMIPGEFADAVKAEAAKLAGIPADRIMLSATHTHSAPSLMQLLGTPPDPGYRAFALPRIIEGLERAVRNLAPARIGWTVVPAPEHTHTRVWIRRPDRMLTDPFGEVSVRAMMHPGHQSPDAIAPSGPSDPALTLIAVQSPDRRPIAVLRTTRCTISARRGCRRTTSVPLRTRLGRSSGRRIRPPALLASCRRERAATSSGWTTAGRGARSAAATPSGFPKTAGRVR